VRLAPDPLRLLHISPIGGSLKVRCLRAKDSSFGEEPGAIGIAHGNAMGDGREIIRGDSEGVGEAGDFIELLRLICRSRALRLARRACRRIGTILAQFGHEPAQWQILRPVAGRCTPVLVMIA
jgi:hypothetical protein